MLITYASNVGLFPPSRSHFTERYRGLGTAYVPHEPIVRGISDTASMIAINAALKRLRLMTGSVRSDTTNNSMSLTHSWTLWYKDVNLCEEMVTPTLTLLGYHHKKKCPKARSHTMYKHT
jgi:hypothetical protein